MTLPYQSVIFQISGYKIVRKTSCKKFKIRGGGWVPPKTPFLALCTPLRTPHPSVTCTNLVVAEVTVDFLGSTEEVYHLPYSELEVHMTELEDSFDVEEAPLKCYSVHHFVGCVCVWGFVA